MRRRAPIQPEGREAVVECHGAARAYSRWIAVVSRWRVVDSPKKYVSVPAIRLRSLLAHYRSLGGANPSRMQKVRPRPNSWLVPCSVTDISPKAPETRSFGSKVCVCEYVLSEVKINLSKREPQPPFSFRCWTTPKSIY